MGDAKQRFDSPPIPSLSLEQCRLIVENVADFVLLVDGESRVLYANRPTPSIDRDSLIGSPALDHLVEPYRQRARQALQQALVTGQAQAVEVQTVYGDWWDSRLLSASDGDGSSMVMIACMDVTARKQAQEALHNEQQTLRQLLDLQERDRRMTVCDIHDGFAQQAVAALMNFQAFGNLYAQDPQQAQAVFERGMHLLQAGIDEARQLISGLRPPILDESGIVAAVNHLLNPLNPLQHLETEFQHSLPERLPRELETTVFRIVQEAVTNARRHSRSPRVRVRIVQEGDQIVIEVEDWGEGFDAATVDQSRFGLKGIRERARLLGGEAAIESWPGRGTRILVCLPCLLSGPDDPPGAPPKNARV